MHTKEDNKMELREIIENFNEAMNEGKSKRKKNCQPGMPYHGKDGRFVNPKEDSGSWSLGKGAASGKDCEHGQSRRPAKNKKEVWTKRPCGRQGKYVCKDGTIKEVELIEDYMMGPSGEVLAPDLRNVSENDLIGEIERRINEGNMSTDRILTLCSAINAASKGEFPSKPK